MDRRGLIALCFLGMIAIIVLSGADATTPEPHSPPYVGIIHNLTNRNISFFSEDMQDNLVVPAKSWKEYLVWQEDFDLTGYVDSVPYFKKNMSVSPGQYQFQAKSYDFMAIVGSD
jgi:hypothetical protein